MRQVCSDFGAELAEFNGEDNHVHLLVTYPPKAAVSALVNSLKGVSARRLRSQFTGRVNRYSMHGHFWSPSYFAASCGGAPLSIIRQYIEQQNRRGQPRPEGRGLRPALGQRAPGGVQRLSRGRAPGWPAGLPVRESSRPRHAAAPERDASCLEHIF